MSNRLRCFLPLSLLLISYSVQTEGFEARNDFLRCRTRFGPTARFATSSREIRVQRKQNDNQNSDSGHEEKPKKLVNLSAAVQRLARETLEKHKAKELSEKGLPSVPEKPLGDLRDLSKAIDRRLQQKSRNAVMLDGFKARNTVESLLEHNYDRKGSRIPREAQKIMSSMRNVAVVFGKALVNDQISLEYAARLRTLARLITHKELEPSLVCFCGGVSAGNNLSDGDAGYMFFKQLCLTEDIPLDNIRVFVERSSNNEGKALQAVANHIQKEYMTEWLAVSQETESLTDEYGMPRSAPRKKVRVHFTLISTDYHLCNLNDIHLRSPNQSLLRPIQYLSNQKRPRKFQGWSDSDDESEIFNKYSISKKKKFKPRGIVDTSWSYQYSTFPFAYSTDEKAAFLGQCYLLGEKLVPLLYNLRAVADEVRHETRLIVACL